MSDHDDDAGDDVLEDEGAERKSGQNGGAELARNWDNAKQEKPAERRAPPHLPCRHIRSALPALHFLRQLATFISGGKEGATLRRPVGSLSTDRGGVIHRGGYSTPRCDFHSQCHHSCP